MSAQEQAPKVFLSYSWSSQNYSERVLQLAEHLERDGVHVILDQWDLAEGQDVNHFMERTVKDPSIEKVLVLCDPVYAEKANQRRGGVGTETLIISPEVYREAEQTKFIPVIMERDGNGEVVMPVYLNSRYYVDLSRPEAEDEQYERLLRMIFGKPAVVRPPRGRRPAFLDDEPARLLTGRSAQQYKDAVHRGRPEQHGYLNAYLERLAEAFAAERIHAAADATILMQHAEASLARFLPYRDEFAEVMQVLSDFGQGLQPYERLHRFFEQLLQIRFGHRPPNHNAELLTENLGFLSRELLLYAVAVLIRTERFHELARLLTPYYVRPYGGFQGELRSVGAFDPHLPLLGREQATSDTAALRIRERATIAQVPYENLAEAEFLLALRTRLEPPLLEGAGIQEEWFPRGAAGDWSIDRLPLRLRLRDPSYLERLLPALGLRSREELTQRVISRPNGQSYWGGARWLTSVGMGSLFGIHMPSNPSST